MELWARGSRRVSVVYLQAAFKVALGDGRRIFVKADGSDRPSARSRSLNHIEREKTCLDVLRGLAVPERVRLPRGALGALLGGRAHAVAQACLPGRDLDKAGLAPMELLGAWAFVAEHLVAFRRHEVLYTDVKCRNVLARREPLSARVIDFNLATCLEPGGTYRRHLFGYTKGFEAPEHHRSGRLTERSLVYQLGMLLPHCWLGVDNSGLRDPRRGLPAFLKRIAALNAAGIGRLVEAALAERPADRPGGYEEVWAAIRGKGRSLLPPEALRAWRVLRAPYARRLAEVGLHGDGR